MKKTFYIICALIITCSWSQAQTLDNVMLDKGTREISLEGDFSTTGSAGSEIDLSLGYGYFIKDFLEIGVAIDYLDNDFVSNAGINVFGEYNYDTFTNWIPFFGLGIGFSDFDAVVVEASSALTVNGFGGIKIFLTEYLALSGKLLLEIASDDIYYDNGDAESINLGLDFGIRVFF